MSNDHPVSARPLSDKGSSQPVKSIPELAWVEKLTWIMDNGFRVPFTSFRIGLDPVIGLIPFLGEVITFSVSGLMVLSMVRHGVSGKVALKMVFNIVLDALVGEIPVIGDIFDFIWKANTRNYNLLLEHQAEGKHQGSGWGIIVMVLGIILLVLTGLVLGIGYLLVKGFLWVGSWF